MVRRYDPYIPESLGDLLDQMSTMIIRSPKFLDKTGYFPEANIQTEFYSLTEGLNRLRPELGEQLYQKLMERAAHMRACFEADPEDETGETRQGIRIALEMEDFIIAKARFERMKGRADPDVPETIGDLLHELDYVMLTSPTFVDKTGYFPRQSLDTEFLTLNNGILGLRPELGEDCCQKLLGLSAQMRSYFEADQGDATGEAFKGRELVVEMMDLIKQRAWEA